MKLKTVVTCANYDCLTPRPRHQTPVESEVRDGVQHVVLIGEADTQVPCEKCGATSIRVASTAH